MSGIVAAYQPRYYPRLHYLARAEQADTFVIYDDVEFSRRSPHHRAPIEHYGKRWLSIPIQHTGVHTTLDEARVDMTEPWPVGHLKTLVGKYGEEAAEWAPFYEELCPSVIDIAYLREHPDEVAKRLEDSTDAGLVDDCLHLDDRWRTRSRNAKLEDLREEKDRIANEITRRKRGDQEADVEALIEKANAVKEQLASAESSCRDAKERRNQVLLELSATLDGAGVERLPMQRLWELDGIDPGTVLADTGLTELTIPLLEELFHRFDVTSDVVRSTELPVEHPGDPSRYQARLTEYLDGDCYLSGEVGYEEYLDEEPFDERGIDVLVQEWTPDWEDGNVCALDVLYSTEDPGRYIE